MVINDLESQINFKYSDRIRWLQKHLKTCQTDFDNLMKKYSKLKKEYADTKLSSSNPLKSRSSQVLSRIIDKVAERVASVQDVAIHDLQITEKRKYSIPRQESFYSKEPLEKTAQGFGHLFKTKESPKAELFRPSSKSKVNIF